MQGTCAERAFQQFGHSLKVWALSGGSKQLKSQETSAHLSRKNVKHTDTHTITPDWRWWEHFASHPVCFIDNTRPPHPNKHTHTLNNCSQVGCPHRMGGGRALIFYLQLQNVAYTICLFMLIAGAPRRQPRPLYRPPFHKIPTSCSIQLRIMHMLMASPHKLEQTHDCGQKNKHTWESSMCFIYLM